RTPARPSCSSAVRRRRVRPSALDEQLRHPHATGLALHVALVPEREREQSPQLTAQILPAGDMLVEQRLHHSRLEESLPPKSLFGQRLACERLELAAQPRRGWDREPSLLAVHDLSRQQRR